MTNKTGTLYEFKSEFSDETLLFVVPISGPTNTGPLDRKRYRGLLKIDIELYTGTTRDNLKQVEIFYSGMTRKWQRYYQTPRTAFVLSSPFSASGRYWMTEPLKAIAENITLQVSCSEPKNGDGRRVDK